MMNGILHEQKGVWARLWTGLFCMAFAVLGMLGMTDAGDERPTISLEKKGDSWEIHLSVGILKLTRGEAMALLLEVEVPDGWELEAVEKAEGAEELSLTVGTGEGVLTLLLDGFPREDGEVLITLRFHVTEEGKPTVTAEDGVVILYCLGEDGSIRRIPLLIQENVEDTAEEGTMVSETVSQEADTEQPSVEPPSTEQDIPMETAADDPSMDEIPTRSPLFGCQETPVHNGLYAVRFWIFEGDTAVICSEGGGVLLLEVTGEGKWNHVTFRGLRRKGKYVFLVYSSEGIVKAVYEDGMFIGYYSA